MLDKSAETSETRQRIVAAANELFRRHGYHGTGMAAIGKLAQATTGSIYHFFPGGKDELTEAVITETGAAYGELFTLIAGEFDTPVEAVQGFFDAAADALDADDFIDLCPIGTIAREVASSNEPLRQAADRVFAQWVATVARSVSAGSEPTPPQRAAATTLVAMIEGGFMLARAGRNSELLRAMGPHAALLVERVEAGAPT